MSGIKIDIDNPKFKLTQEQILEIVEKLDCKASTKELLQKYFSKEVYIIQENTQYYDRTLARVRPLMDFYNSNVYLRGGEFIIEGADAFQLLQEIKIMADKNPIIEDTRKQIATYAKLIEGGYMEVRTNPNLEYVKSVDFVKVTDKLISEVLATI
ncbi:hypothetical protein NIES267_73610 (plasmid) [Calothrix parasitica NIES-267]|uniref:Uncharacterized protein n=1 Tax=Calothrix parasitica NIES-267 TaxID=1973488 RepID=A0A1Z4M2Y7_9CYAN|nr:hypothetical protein NIES267_73610 [Calothrix parasitica NIES-267]